MMKLAGYTLTALASLAWGADEVGSYADGQDRVREDGWVLLCHSADWDTTHDEQWMRRQTAISSACGNALLLYVPVYQNPTPEQAAACARLLEGAQVELNTLPSVPCALLLDREGVPYASIAGDEFMEHAAGHIRQAQAQLRTRSELLRQAAEEEGSQKAQSLSSICRLDIAMPSGLQQMVQEADPADSAGVVELSPFDPWALAERVFAMPWEAAIAELDRIQQAQLSKEERQAVLAIRMGCVQRHLGAAGAREIRHLAQACTALAPGTALGKAAQRASKLWGSQISLRTGWRSWQLPRMAAECEVAGAREFSRDGEYRISFVPTRGESPLRVTRVTLYNGDAKISEDAHTCCLKAGEELRDNEYMLLVLSAPSNPRLVISFDQQGQTDSHGSFALRYFTPDGVEEVKIDPAQAAAEEARREVSTREGERGHTDLRQQAPTVPGE